MICLRLNESSCLESESHLKHYVLTFLNYFMSFNFGYGEPSQIFHFIFIESDRIIFDYVLLISFKIIFYLFICTFILLCFEPLN